MHLVFLGPPACGKGTQSAILVQKYGYYHLSTGDLMRKEIATGSELGETIKQNIENGILAASEIVNELLKKDVENHKQMSILFDGYPRKIDQAEFLSRVTCKACGAVYNLRTNPPKEDGVCDSCGSHELVRRGDDNEEILKNRIQSFFKETAPLREFYQKRGILTVINARASVEIVTEQIINAL
jgi:adenylate kinase